MPPINRFQHNYESKRPWIFKSPLRIFLVITITLFITIVIVNYRYHIFSHSKSIEMIVMPSLLDSVPSSSSSSSSSSQKFRSTIITSSKNIDSNDNAKVNSKSGYISEKDRSSHSFLPEMTIESENIQPNQKKKIAYAITVTKDGPFVDGALVLGYSAKKVHDSKKGYHSKYDADLIAFVVPGVVTSRSILQAYGWKLYERTLPVTLNEIENQDYAQKMKDSGCCGADEFLKLWAYTLTEYHRVVHLDMDSVIFQNMDELYEMDKECLYTGDYGMKGKSPVAPAQGGFLVIRPSMETFEEYRAIIRKGDHGSNGWGGSKIGNFWGGQTIQGIIPYFYYSIHSGNGQELNRCIYNCMVDNPYWPGTTRCLDGQPTCEDCRQQEVEHVKSAHFTICQKPWTCTEHTNPRNAVLCEKLHKQWFELRDELERETGVDMSYRQPSRFVDSMGMCRRYGDHAYLPIPLTLLHNK